ncbi:MAG: IS3 family transposase [Gemmatimonas sp.]|nr:IS3 family transposase [Gemmatimonas sp.]
MKAHQAEYPITLMCRVLGISRSGYYAWRKRSPSPHSQRDERLRERITRIHGKSRGTYGRPRIHAELKEEGERVGGKRIARLMRGLRASGGKPPQRLHHHAARSPCPAGSGFGGAGLHSRRSRSALGGGYHLYPHRGGVSLSGGSPGRLEPPGGGLGDGHASADDAGAGRAEHGARAATPSGGDSPFGSGDAVHVDRLRISLPGDGRAAVDGIRRGLL